jgi:hypothetical protein
MCQSAISGCYINEMVPATAIAGITMLFSTFAEPLKLSATDSN